MVLRAISANEAYQISKHFFTLRCWQGMADAHTENDVVEIDETVHLSEAEQKAIQEFISEVNKESTIGDGHEIDEETALRFLRARKFDIERAVALFHAHKNVCSQFDLEDLTPLEEPLWSELLSGKFTVLPGKDLAGASICLFTERLHFPNKTTHKAVLKSILFQLNEVTKSDETQLNGIVLIYDMKWASYKNFDYDLCMKTLSLLKGAFPARLKHVYVLSAPLWFRATLTILSSFLREKIRSRVEVLKTSQDLLARIPASTLPIHLGGHHLLDHDLWLQQCIASYNRTSNKKELAVSEFNGRTKLNHTRDFSTKITDESDKNHDDSDDVFKNYPSLNVYELIDYINEAGKDAIYEQYRQIKSPPPLGTFHESRHPFNLVKNRYKDVLCYDHSRVRLPIIDEDDFSGYINASYVDGYMNGKRQQRTYICTQGPLENTAFDFWRMILENRVRVIVMITRCVERGREKCFKYWPMEDETVDYGSLTVRNLSETTFQDYVIRNLQVHHVEEGENIIKNLVHVQFTSWPDFGVPSSADKFLDILNQVRKFQNIGDESEAEQIRDFQNDYEMFTPAPVVVHCSAGIGRTGTFLAIDISLRGIDWCGMVNVPNVVQGIRKQRAFCIQTEEQYAFCYTAILQHILHKMKESADKNNIKMIEDCLHAWMENTKI